MTDRLAGLLQHYSLSARMFHSGPLCGHHHFAAPYGYVHLVKHGPVTARAAIHDDLVVREPSVLFYPRVAPHRLLVPPGETAELFCAEVELGASAGNPLAMALPPVLLIPLAEVPGMGPTLDLLVAEALAEQCGRQAAIDRLCELLLIQLLRYLMDRRLAPTGLLAGLADPKLARAIAAMHDAPQAPWTLASLAERAGMSRARFAAAFRETVGVTPGDYLAEWRMNVSCTLLRQGRPVAVVADQVGYGSPNALARAFRARIGCAPREWLAQVRGEALSGSSA